MLPWRDAQATPWRVLVSEVMLQQTPVARVLPVFEEWLDRWPDPPALAAAAAGEAVRAWGRLGYPRRALRLWQASVVLTTSFDGAVPDSLPDLLALPGVGSYTARAVLAFGFGRRVPVVDTNVRRVLNRLVRGNDDAGPATATDLVELATLLPDDEPTAARLSIALMEFGALVCTKVQPRCAECPVRDSCRWLALGAPASGAQRRVQRWHGTDRQVRGRLLAVLRAGHSAVSPDELRLPGVDDAQWQRCLDSLEVDGLLERRAGNRYSLPG